MGNLKLPMLDALGYGKGGLGGIFVLITKPIVSRGSVTKASFTLVTTNCQYSVKIRHAY